MSLRQIKNIARQLGVTSEQIDNVDDRREIDGPKLAAIELVMAANRPQSAEPPPDSWPAIESLPQDHPALPAAEVWTSPVDRLRYHHIWLGRNRQFRAAATGNVAKVKLWLSMLSKPEDINAQTAAYNYTSFCLACEYGQVEIVKLLLKHGADPSIPNYLNLTGRECAERANQTAVLELLNTSTNAVLQDELQRSLTRPMAAIVEERLEIAWDRLCAHFLELSPYSSWHKLNEGMYGIVWGVDDPFPIFRN